MIAEMVFYLRNESLMTAVKLTSDTGYFWLGYWLAGGVKSLPASLEPMVPGCARTC